MMYWLYCKRVYVCMLHNTIALVLWASLISFFNFSFLCMYIFIINYLLLLCLILMPTNKKKKNETCSFVMLLLFALFPLSHTFNLQSICRLFCIFIKMFIKLRLAFIFFHDLVLKNLFIFLNLRFIKVEFY